MEWDWSYPGYSVPVNRRPVHGLAVELLRLLLREHVLREEWTWSRTVLSGVLYVTAGIRKHGGMLFHVLALVPVIWAH